MTHDGLDGPPLAPVGSNRSEGRSRSSTLTCSTLPTAPMGSAGIHCGQVLTARYRVERPLSSYGSGHVFKAHDLVLGEKVAIKLVRASSSESPAVRRLLLEARLARRINHPHVLRVHDVGIHHRSGSERDDIFFISMQLARGVPLSHLVKSGLLELSAAVAVARQVLTALHAAHAAHVSHRQLSADAVIIQGPLTAPVSLVTGFGQHEARDDSAESTTQAQIPDAVEMDPELDLHRFGELLRELLTLPRATAVAVPPELIEVAERCSNSKRLDRFCSAAQALEALEQQVAHPP